MRENVLMESNTMFCVSLMSSSDRLRRRPAQRIQATSTWGMASRSAEFSMTRRGTQASRKFWTFSGLIRNGRPQS